MQAFTSRIGTARTNRRHDKRSTAATAITLTTGREAMPRLEASNTVWYNVCKGRNSTFLQIVRQMKLQQHSFAHQWRDVAASHNGRQQSPFLPRSSSITSTKSFKAFSTNAGRSLIILIFLSTFIPVFTPGYQSDLCRTSSFLLSRPTVAVFFSPFVTKRCQCHHTSSPHKLNGCCSSGRRHRGQAHSPRRHILRLCLYESSASEASVLLCLRGLSAYTAARSRADSTAYTASSSAREPGADSSVYTAARSRADSTAYTASSSAREPGRLLCRQEAADPADPWLADPPSPSSSCSSRGRFGTCCHRHPVPQPLPLGVMVHHSLQTQRAQRPQHGVLLLEAGVHRPRGVADGGGVSGVNLSTGRRRRATRPPVAQVARDLTNSAAATYARLKQPPKQALQAERELTEPVWRAQSPVSAPLTEGRHSGRLFCPLSAREARRSDRRSAPRPAGQVSCAGVTRYEPPLAWARTSGGE